jgi:hypothetical protein
MIYPAIISTITVGIRDNLRRDKITGTMRATIVTIKSG